MLGDKDEPRRIAGTNFGLLDATDICGSFEPRFRGLEPFAQLLAIRAGQTDLGALPPQPSTPGDMNYEPGPEVAATIDEYVLP